MKRRVDRPEPDETYHGYPITRWQDRERATDEVWWRLQFGHPDPEVAVKLGAPT